MANEAKTSIIFRELLRKAKYYDDADTIVEEQKSDNAKIDSLMKNASKRGNKNGFPDFIIYSKKYPELIIVVEAKADINRHISNTMDHYADYAVDGALLYASFLSKEFDVLAIGVSGEYTDKFRISHYLQLKEEKTAHPIFDDKILSIEAYFDGIQQSNYKFNQDYAKLIAYTKTLNETLHAKKIKQLVDNVILCLDGDNAGNMATYKAIDVLKQVGLNVRVVRLSGAKDPDEFIKKYGKNNFLEVLTNSIDCVDFVLTDSAKKYNLENNAEKNQYIQEALNYISNFSTPAEQEIYLNEVQKLVKIPIDALRKSMQKTETKPAEEIEENLTDTPSNNYILESKIMLLASILYKKLENFEDISGLFNSNDELSELYKFLVQKKNENEDVTVSSLFDNFEISKNSLIDRVINYVFPETDVYKQLLSDTIKRVKLLNLNNELKELKSKLSKVQSSEELTETLKRMQELTMLINKEKAWLQ